MKKIIAIQLLLTLGVLSMHAQRDSVDVFLDKYKDLVTDVWAKDSVTEAQVAELSDGTLMLNMRDNRGGSRSVATTRDLGRTWTEHPTSRKALRESVCMASLIAVKADENVLGRHILLFSNPDTVRGRNHITIKASLDDGMTFAELTSRLDGGVPAPFRAVVQAIDACAMTGLEVAGIHTADDIREP